MNHDRIHRVMSGDDRTMTGSLLRGTTTVAEPFYRLGTAVRNAMFNRSLRKPVRLPRPTISVGNLTTGGTGKTPVVAHLAQRLVEQGHHPAILTRGYHGGDEARELGEALGDDATVAVSADRVRGARTAREQHPAVDVFLLDDGFQHRQVARDLDLVLIDAMRPFGFGHLLPRGLLREPPGSLRRADAVIVTRADQVTPEVLHDIDQQIERYAGRPPIAHAVHRWDNAGELAGNAVLGVCGIGNPEAFFTTLESHSGRVTDRLTFDDHHRYTDDELRELLERATKLRVDAVVTTEKDYVKWKPLLEKVEVSVPIILPRLTIDFLDGADGLDALVCGASSK